MKRFCITGGIACGKSEVAQGLEKRGWKIIDTDRIAREVVEPGQPGYKKVVDAFGRKILNSSGLIDRNLLGQVVFASSEQRILLNSILHPLIRFQWKTRLSEHLSRTPGLPAVVVIPLLYETGGEVEFDSVACVASPAGQQLARLRSRGLDEEEAMRRVRSQQALEEKIRRSSVMIWNGGSLELLQAQTDGLARHWQDL